MEKNDIVMFVEQKKRGIYNVIVQEYQSIVSSSPINLALILISQDLERSTGKKVELKYVSLASAISKIKSHRNPIKPEIKRQTESLISKKKWDFKDEHEIPNTRNARPGSFSID